MRGKSDDTPKKFTKSNLPSKDCIVCNRPFEWRKKWERCWDEVKYCSERCRRDGKGGGGKEDTQTTKMKFNFDSGGVSDSSNFIRVFGSAAALPPISIQQREMSNYNQKIKGILGFAAAIAGLTAAEVLSYPSAAVAAGTSRPTKKEIAEMFLDEDWESKATVLRKSSFRRLDEKPDSQYYESPRFVEHIDEKAVSALLSFHTKMLDDLSNKLYQKVRKVDVLDICSSWTSHLPVSDFPVRTGTNIGAPNKVVGLGMNKAELERNSQLSEYLVQDLNVSPILPFDKNSFDAILVQLSIGSFALQYLLFDGFYITVRFILKCVVGAHLLSITSHTSLYPICYPHPYTSSPSPSPIHFITLTLTPTLHHPHPHPNTPSLHLHLLLDYLTKPLDLLSEANRVLRPGGAIFITYVAANSG